eukprot:COSAG04_NODE_3825_length_2492_cov_2.320100_1_plen_719_part_10
MAEQLARVDKLIATWLPDPEYDGLAALDFEYWTPVWEEHTSSGSWHGRRYQTLSLATVRCDHPDWNETRVQKEAKQQFEAAAVEWLAAVLDRLHAHRPNTRFGYYGLPNSYLGVSYNSPAGSYLRDRNDKCARLWSVSGAIYPSIYLEEGGVATPAQQRAYVESMVNESRRLALGANVSSHAWTSRETGPRPLVLPFQESYYHCYGHGCNDHLEIALSRADLLATLQIPFEQGADGVVLWDTPLAWNRVNETIKNISSGLLGNTTRSIIDQACACSAAQCRGHGRCIDANATCECYSGFCGDSCGESCEAVASKTDDAEACSAPVDGYLCASRTCVGVAADCTPAKMSCDCAGTMPSLATTPCPAPAGGGNNDPLACATAGGFCTPFNKPPPVGACVPVRNSDWTSYMKLSRTTTLDIVAGALVVGGLLYAMVGALYTGAVRNARGWAMLPHRQFWSHFGGLVRDGFAVSAGRSTGYQRLNTQSPDRGRNAQSSSPSKRSSPSRRSPGKKRGEAKEERAGEGDARDNSRAANSAAAVPGHTRAGDGGRWVHLPAVLIMLLFVAADAAPHVSADAETATRFGTWMRYLPLLETTHSAQAPATPNITATLEALKQSNQRLFGLDASSCAALETLAGFADAARKGYPELRLFATLSSHAPIYEYCSEFVASHGDGNKIDVNWTATGQAIAGRMKDHPNWLGLYVDDFYLVMCSAQSVSYVRH